MSQRIRPCDRPDATPPPADPRTDGECCEHARKLKGVTFTLDWFAKIYASFHAEIVDAIDGYYDPEARHKAEWDRPGLLLNKLCSIRDRMADLIVEEGDGAAPGQDQGQDPTVAPPAGPDATEAEAGTREAEAGTREAEASHDAGVASAADAPRGRTLEDASRALGAALAGLESSLDSYLDPRGKYKAEGDRATLLFARLHTIRDQLRSFFDGRGPRGNRRDAAARARTTWSVTYALDRDSPDDGIDAGDDESGTDPDPGAVRSPAADQADEATANERL